MIRTIFFMRWLVVGLLLVRPALGTCQEKNAQDVAPAAATAVDNSPFVFTVQQDHQNMLEQLGITKLRPGKDGNANAKGENAANYDEAKANPYPVLPDLLTTNDGQKVTTADQWWKHRRPEIVELVEREVVGRVPAHVPRVTWEVRETREKTVGGKDAIEKHIVGVVDNSTCPDIQVNISMSLTLPKQSDRPVPVLMMFGWTPFEPSPFGPGFGRGNRPQGPTKYDRLFDAGWGYAIINPSTVQDDAGGWRANPFGRRNDPNAEPPKPSGAGLTRGIIGLTNHGQPRKPDQWGSLRAWAWGASRALDYLESVSEVDSGRVGIDGVSRYGKAALVTLAFDQRFAAGLIASSGEGGTSLYRRNFGESVENLTGSGAYHWMAGNFIKYGAQESTFGRKDANDLPVDSHMLIALCAPRLTFISHGVPEKGDALWLDHQGSFMASIAAQPVFRLLGARDLGRSDDYTEEKMPAVNVDLLDGHLAWRQHDGGHTDDPNIEHFARWANKMWSEKVAAGNAAPAPAAARARPSDSTHNRHHENRGVDTGTDAHWTRLVSTALSTLVATAITAPQERPAAPQAAEVPPAVRIQRPTSEDIATAEKALAQFVESADPKIKALLKQYPTLVEVRPPRPNSAIVPNLAPFFRQKHQANVAVAKEGTAELLLMGDSITDFWRNESGPFAGKPVFDEAFGKWKVANFGIAGDTTQGVLYRLRNGEGEGFQPKAVMLMIGTNNTGSHSAAEIAEGIGAVVLELQNRFPQAKILLLGVFPRARPGDAVRAQIKEINQTISKLHDGSRVHYLDIGDKFLDESGAIPQDVMPDALHPNAKGYRIWADAVKEPLEKLMQGS